MNDFHGGDEVERKRYNNKKSYKCKREGKWNWGVTLNIDLLHERPRCAFQQTLREWIRVADMVEQGKNFILII